MAKYIDRKFIVAMQEAILKNLMALQPFKVGLISMPSKKLISDLKVASPFATEPETVKFTFTEDGTVADAHLAWFGNDGQVAFSVSIGALNGRQFTGECHIPGGIRWPRIEHIA